MKNTSKKEISTQTNLATNNTSLQENSSILITNILSYLIALLNNISKTKEISFLLLVAMILISYCYLYKH